MSAQPLFGDLVLTKCRLAGFRSIRDAEIELRRLNVVIGANGAGKSNLAAFFALLRASVDGQLQSHVSRLGGPAAFLYLGPKTTSEIRCALEFSSEAGRGTLYQKLQFRAPDSLVYGDNHAGGLAGFNWVGPNDAASKVCSVIADKGSRSNAVVESLVYDRIRFGIHVYHFNDTTLAAPIRSSGNVEDNRQLYGDGCNLAAFLYRLEDDERQPYTSASSPRCGRLLRSLRTSA